ncbi:signal peptidase II [uncultured Mobiluncus sp.]|uniref:signal peptidase II n=1 Tax=uncultured Mobiluncus sp. TaxID=293425 RepID=UPI0025F9E0DC|nr:signal peptidase II [uncultured Mobiluncus sp.]
MVAVGGIDQITKRLALRFLAADTAPQPLLGSYVTLHLTHNPGAALSIGQGQTLVVTVFSLVLVFILTVLSFLTHSRTWAYVLAVVAGGGMANLVDRFQGPTWGTGKVVDFIDYFGWFVGNVADIFVVVGVAVIFVLLLRGVPLFTPPQPAATSECAEAGADPDCSVKGKDS